MADAGDDAKLARRRDWDEVARGLPSRGATTIFTITSTMADRMLEAVGAAPGNRLLDVACGPGTLVARAGARGVTFVGLDFAPAMVEEASRLHPGVDFRVGDAEHLPFPDASFECVTSNFGVQMLPHPDRAMAEARRVLVPGGRYSFATFHDSPSDDLFRLVEQAVAAHGTPVPPRSFWGPADCVGLLEQAGFAHATAGEHLLQGRIERAQDVLDVIETAGRPWRMLRAQTPEARARIDRAIVDGAARHRTASGEIVLRVATILACGQRP